MHLAINTPPFAHYASDCRAIGVPLRLVLSQATNIYTQGDYWHSSRQFHRISSSCLHFFPPSFYTGHEAKCSYAKGVIFCVARFTRGPRMPYGLIKTVGIVCCYDNMYHHNAVCCRQVSSASCIFVCFRKVEVLLALKRLRKRMRKVLHLFSKHLKKCHMYVFWIGACTNAWTLRELLHLWNFHPFSEGNSFFLLLLLLRDVLSHYIPAHLSTLSIVPLRDNLQTSGCCQH